MSKFTVIAQRDNVVILQDQETKQCFIRSRYEPAFNELTATLALRTHPNTIPPDILERLSEYFAIPGEIGGAPYGRYYGSPRLFSRLGEQTRLMMEMHRQLVREGYNPDSGDPIQGPRI